MIGSIPALIIFCKIHFLLISENEFFHEMKCDGITSFHGIHAHMFHWAFNSTISTQILIFSPPASFIHSDSQSAPSSVTPHQLQVTAILSFVAKVSSQSTLDKLFQC